MSEGKLDFEGERMRRGPKVEPIRLSIEENNRLVEWTRRHKTSQALALRARIVLACQQERSNREVAVQFRITLSKSRT